MRWGIRQISIYSHHGERRDLFFEPTSVNIITGPSHTGKSAIPEIIDYCMGSGECLLPGIVREVTSWVGMIWERHDQRFAIARRVPPSAQKSVDEMYWHKGTPKDARLLPASARGFHASGSRLTVLRLIEQAFGIAEVKSETFNDQRLGVTVTARHTVPYMLQSDEVIINKINLLRGMDDERRQHIIETLPYFLKVTDERTAALEARYRRVLRELKAEQRRIESVEKLGELSEDRIRGFVAEAVSVGLATPQSDEASVDNLLTLLRGTQAWKPGAAVTDSGDEVSRLYASEAASARRLAMIRQDIRAAESTLRAAEGFDNAVAEQHFRLSQINLFTEDGDTTTCPICSSKVTNPPPAVSSIRASFNVLSDELAEIVRDRPKVDAYLTAKRDDLHAEAGKLSNVRQQIRSLISEEESTEGAEDLNYRRGRVIGRISLFLDSAASTEQPTNDRLHKLQSDLSELEGQVDLEAKRERLEIEQATVASIATRVLAQLPFEPAYRESPVYFLARRIECGVVTSARRIAMQQIGSDENYLSLHVAMMAAFHRFFKERNSPVPGVLLFDQLSRPYYPPEEVEGEVVLKDNTESASLKAYFDFLFKEVEEQKDLQVIVLEHAYFESDPRYVAAVRYRWGEEKLVPDGWPKQV